MAWRSTFPKGGVVFKVLTAEWSQYRLAVEAYKGQMEEWSQSNPEREDYKV